MGFQPNQPQAHLCPRLDRATSQPSSFAHVPPSAWRSVAPMPCLVKALRSGCGSSSIFPGSLTLSSPPCLSPSRHPRFMLR